MTTTNTRLEVGKGVVPLPSMPFCQLCGRQIAFVEFTEKVGYLEDKKTSEFGGWIHLSCAQAVQEPAKREQL